MRGCNRTFDNEINIAPINEKILTYKAIALIGLHLKSHFSRTLVAETQVVSRFRTSHELPQSSYKQ